MAFLIEAGTACPCAIDPTRVFLLLASAKSFMPFLPQASNAASGTSVRAGTEPFTTLNADWNPGSMIAEASLVCASALSAPTLNITNWSELNDTLPCVPGVRKHKKSCPGTFLALMNSPLAQSPIIWNPALPLITMLEARFQSRPEKSLSTNLRNCPMCENTFSLGGEFSDLASRSTSAFLKKSNPPVDITTP